MSRMPGPSPVLLALTWMAACLPKGTAPAPSVIAPARAFTDSLVADGFTVRPDTSEDLSVGDVVIGTDGLDGRIRPFKKACLDGADLYRKVLWDKASGTWASVASAGINVPRVGADAEVRAAVESQYGNVTHEYLEEAQAIDASLRTERCTGAMKSWFSAATKETSERLFLVTGLVRARTLLDVANGAGAQAHGGVGVLGVHGFIEHTEGGTLGSEEKVIAWRLKPLAPPSDRPSVPAIALAAEQVPVSAPAPVASPPAAPVPSTATPAPPPTACQVLRRIGHASVPVLGEVGRDTRIFWVEKEDQAYGYFLDASRPEACAEGDFPSAVFLDMSGVIQQNRQGEVYHRNVCDLAARRDAPEMVGQFVTRDIWGTVVRDRVVDDLGAAIVSVDDGVGLMDPNSAVEDLSACPQFTNEHTRGARPLMYQLPRPGLRSLVLVAVPWTGTGEGTAELYLAEMDDARLRAWLVSRGG